MIKTFNTYIKEEVDNSSTNDFLDIKIELSDMIRKSTNSSDKDVIDKFIDAYLEDKDSTNIEGLISDSDIYEFYLKYASDIDEIGLKLEIFNKAPITVNKTSLFDYLVWGTTEAIISIVKDLKKEGLYENEEV